MKQTQVLYLMLFFGNSASQYNYIGSLLPSDYLHLIESHNERAHGRHSKIHKYHKSNSYDEDCNCSCGRCNPPSKCCENICLLCKAQFDEPKVVYMPVPYSIASQSDHQVHINDQSYQNQNQNMFNNQHERLYEHSNNFNHEANHQLPPIRIEIMPQGNNYSPVTTGIPSTFEHSRDIMYEQHEPNFQLSPIHIDIIPPAGNYAVIATEAPISTTVHTPTITATDVYSKIILLRTTTEKPSCQEPSFKSILEGEDECNLLVGAEDEVVKSKILDNIETEKECGSKNGNSEVECNRNAHYHNRNYLDDNKNRNNNPKNRTIEDSNIRSHTSDAMIRHNLNEQHFQHQYNLRDNFFKNYNLNDNHVNKYEGEHVPKHKETVLQIGTNNYGNREVSIPPNLNDHHNHERLPKLSIPTDQYQYPMNENFPIRIRMPEAATKQEKEKRFLVTTLRKTNTDIFPDYGIVPITNTFAKRLLEDYGSIKVLQPVRKTIDRYR